MVRNDRRILYKKKKRIDVSYIKKVLTNGFDYGRIKIRLGKMFFYQLTKSLNVSLNVRRKSSWH
jgi:hypothetical protein